MSENVSFLRVCQVTSTSIWLCKCENIRENFDVCEFAILSRNVRFHNWHACNNVDEGFADIFRNELWNRMPRVNFNGRLTQKLWNQTLHGISRSLIYCTRYCLCFVHWSPVKFVISVLKQTRFCNVPHTKSCLYAQATAVATWASVYFKHKHPHAC